ncbi:LOW QUALITY PROTEIN: transcriptional repressor for the dissimilation of sn-glycerol 3-phosphate, DeoR family protein [Marinobacter adhaerens HP15]|uniref:Transcriptional repressor for the dissimilation of sn-glycerol 3-phosphate, DeoR family protein n=1 Tax=Marinobacter adhaerens (strain DSM 23420 / HP15) TaxID=225937 RepID=E4PF51_MARAH|nr:LOW QUALITY PROTEIN: transcriptional repressor for the dissimilation of sn-glycerol 3-phosphate, DeoR family protein [Marinobacter adhaerens HP15]
MAQRRRQDLIMELIQQNGFVTTEQLVDQFKVTPQTIRRDLNELAKQKKLRRHHGGAGIDSSTVNTAYQARKIMDLEAKERIAEALVELIPDNSSMFINIGTTTETIAKALLEKTTCRSSPTTCTSHLFSPPKRLPCHHCRWGSTNRDGGIVGEATRDFINQFKMDFGIIGISGIHNDGSLLDFDYREVRVAQAIIANSNQVLLAADHSKFGRNAMVRLGSISQADHVFTDQQPPVEIRQLLTEHNVQLHIV